jgi:hypothetical protein
MYYFSLSNRMVLSFFMKNYYLNVAHSVLCNDIFVFLNLREIKLSATIG